MKTAIAESSSHALRSPEATKASLMEAFGHFLDELSQPLLLKMVQNEVADSYFEALRSALAKSDRRKPSPQVRNQIAFMKGRALLLENIQKAYELLDSRTVCEILDITRQALNKKLQNGQVLAYTDGSRKHYPAFQFRKNLVAPSIAKLMDALDVDPKDATQVNALLGFLAQAMDFSNPGEPENLHPRYTLLDDNAAFEIIVRDFKHRLSMGR
ncbi:MAG TPA: hypothetical protein VJS90_11640 [Pseudomonas sp.]|uniref:hypothetical protein n=1 Tax=Pseudomonas sp. TaxID=306 RepID=UPI002B49E076|nr:hypothetical protein [Pseudomonas sp.]HKS13677.1 hypothetical protein [Pseudomonas sp.]